MAIDNPIFEEHMFDLFGKDRLKKLRKSVEYLPPDDRESVIIEELASALGESGKRYVLPFRFIDEHGTRTSHHLIFVSKHIKGYNIMKNIMAKESSSRTQGVPSFEYNPATIRTPLLFDLSRPLEGLGDMLLKEFAGKKMRMIDVFNQHHVGKRFVERNYRDVLTQLEKDGKIKAVPPAKDRPKRSGKPTFADDVLVIFPREKK
jgi:hypothetical protein